MKNVCKITVELQANKSKIAKSEVEYKVTKETEKMIYLESENHKTKQLKDVLGTIKMSVNNPSHISVTAWCDANTKDVARTHKDIKTHIQTELDLMAHDIQKMSSQLK